MRIGIDTCGCNHARSGVGSYILSFVSNLPQSEDFTFELFGLEADRFTYSSGKEISFSSIPDCKNLKAVQKWHKRKAVKFIQKNKYDVVLFPNPMVVTPVVGNFKSIVQISVPYSAHSDKKSLKRVEKVLKKVDYIIAASDYIKKDLISNGVPEEKITIVHNGIDHTIFYPVLDLDSDILDIKPFAIKRPYFLYCSSLSGARKKHIELIKAFELFKEKNKTEHRLVIAGDDGEYSTIVHNAAYNSKYADNIFITGFFPFESLAKLYAGSDGCIVPAVREGAGLPVLEAMACGVPVLCSSSGALPEMGSDVPLYFDSDNIEEMADAMERIISEEELRKKMIDSGIERASSFNWKTTVTETLNVIKVQ